jgi:hypothetical protein
MAVHVSSSKSNLDGPGRWEVPESADQMAAKIALVDR